MSRCMKAVLLAAVLALSAAIPAAAHEYKAGDLVIGHPWSRPAGAGMNGAGYMTLTNAGSEPDILMAVETPAAAKVEIHEGAVSGGVMRMARLKHGLTIPAKGSVALAPGGYHLMMLKLTRPFVVGDKVPATLVFQHAGRLNVVFTVQDAPAMAMPDHH